MLTAALLMAAALSQRTQSFTITLDAPVVDATPLFGPVREAEWAPHWSPHFLHPPAGAQAEGVVFTTTTPKGFEQLWLLTEYDPAAGRVAYVVVSPGYMTNQITIRVTPVGESRSRATVTYRHSALVPRANPDVERLDADWAAQQQSHWEAAVNAALRKGERKDDAHGRH
jgi:hypothetical protein